MTRKDYKAIAGIMARMIPTEQRNRADQFKQAIHINGNTVTALANYMEADNPQFDRDRFIKACCTAAR